MEWSIFKPLETVIMNGKLKTIIFSLFFVVISYFIVSILVGFDCKSSMQSMECVWGATRGGIVDDWDSCHLTCDYVLQNENFLKCMIALGCLFVTGIFHFTKYLAKKTMNGRSENE